jgi:hypothetical protein
VKFKPEPSENDTGDLFILEKSFMFSAFTLFARSALATTASSGVKLVV